MKGTIFAPFLPQEEKSQVFLTAVTSQHISLLPHRQLLSQFFQNQNF